MGFERSFTKSIKYVSIFDSALDWDRDAPPDETPDKRQERLAAAFTAYREKPDKDTLPVRAGEEPAVFELAPLSMAARARVEQFPDERWIEQALEAVACSLRSVSGCKYDNEPLVIEHKDGRVKAPILERLNYLVGNDVFRELCTRIMYDSRLGPTSR